MLPAEPCSPPAPGRTLGLLLALHPITAQLRQRGWGREGSPSTGTAPLPPGAELWDGSNLPHSPPQAW